MRSRIVLIAFTLLAPITVPIYAAFLALSNLLGGAFYIVIEATAAPLLGRPVTLSNAQMALLAVPVLAAAPIVALLHLVAWLGRLAIHSLIWVGHWQTGARTTGWSLVGGLAWSLVALWTTVTCLNAAIGSAWLGSPVAGKDVFVEHLTRERTLGNMPPEMQARRRQIIDQLDTHRQAVHPLWDHLAAKLRNDDVRFDTDFLPQAVLRKLAGLPWFFYPAAVSEDRLDHSVLLLGPLFFAWMVLIRWPRTFHLLRRRFLQITWFLLRSAAAFGAVYYIVTWVPLTAYYGFWFEPQEMSRAFFLFHPAAWLGFDYARWVRPEWHVFNAGLWMAMVLATACLWWLAWRAAPFLGWPRYYVAFLAARLLQRKRIAFFSVGAVTLCVAMMIIVISVMGGFVDSIRTRAHGLLGDLVMDSSLQGFPYYQEFIDRLAALRDDGGRPMVVQATPIIYSYGLLQFSATKRTSAVKILGIRLDEFVRVNRFGDDLFYQERYGGTTLAPIQQPVYAFNDDDLAVLPPEMEERFRAFLAAMPPREKAEEEQRYARSPGDFYPGPGVFSGPGESPGFAGQAYPGVIIGRNLIARRLPSGEFDRLAQYPRGEHCFLTVVPLTRGGDVSPEPPPKPSFRYVDDSRTGIHEIDSQNVYVDFATLQALLSMQPMERADGGGLSGARCSQIQMKLRPDIGDDRARLIEARRTIENEWRRFTHDQPSDAFEYNMMQNVRIVTWEEMQSDYISAIEKEKVLVLIMFGVISTVAVFLILCIFYMIVQEKTRDIGIIKSVGGSATGVAAVFLAYGGGIGLVGCIVGSLVGTTFVEHINDVQDWLARLNPEWRVWSPETYSFDKIPDVWKWSEVIWIGVLAIIASIAGATLPALRAGRTWPVESLRYE